MKRSLFYTSIMLGLVASTHASLSVSTQLGFHAIRHGDCSSSDTSLISHLGGASNGNEHCIGYTIPTLGIAIATNPSECFSLKATAEFMNTDHRQIGAGRGGVTDYGLTLEPKARLSVAGLYQYQRAAFGLMILRTADRYEIATLSAPQDVLSYQDHPIYYYGPTASFDTQFKNVAISTQVGYLIGTLTDHASGSEKITNESVDSQNITASVAIRYAK